MTKRWTIAAALAVTQGFAAVASACPMCKDSITDTGKAGAASAGLPSGFNVSVYLMLVGLFCVMGLVGGIIVKGVRGTNVTPPSNKPPGFPLD
jgi:hypothetical protein